MRNLPVLDAGIIRALCSIIDWLDAWRKRAMASRPSVLSSDLCHSDASV